MFDAEMAAIAIAATKAELLINDFPNITHIEIFTDNAAVVLAINELKLSPAQNICTEISQSYTRHA
jgi:hypothetical protein